MPVLVQWLSNTQPTRSLSLRHGETVRLSADETLHLGSALRHAQRRGNDLQLLLIGEGDDGTIAVVVEGYFATGNTAVVATGTPDQTRPLERSDFPAPEQPDHADDDAQTAADTSSSGQLIEAHLTPNLADIDRIATLFAPHPQLSPALSGSVDVRPGPTLETAPTNLEAHEPAHRGDAPALAPLDPPTLASAGGERWINGLHLAQDGFTLVGHSAPGFALEIRLNGSQGTRVRTLSVQDGRWQLKLSADDIRALGEGALGVSATVVSPQGQPLSHTGELALEIDTTPPAAPRVSLSGALTDGLLTAAEIALAPPVLQGEAEPGARVRIQLTDINGRTAWVDTQANAHGQWTVLLTPALAGMADGRLEIEARSFDPAGNSTGAPPQEIALRQNPPAAPSELRLTADSDSAGRDNITSDATPTLEGLAPKGCTVRVYRDANLDGLAQESEYLTTLTTDPSSGRFVFAPGPLDDGRHTYLFASEDEVGNRSPQVAAGRFEVDTLAVAPGLGAVGEDDRLSFDELQAASVPFSGTGEPGAKITLRLSQGTTEIVFETQVQSNGIWRIDVPANIGPDADPSRSLRFAFGSGFNGEISVQVSQTDVAGNVSASTTRPVYLRTEPLPEISALRLEDGQDTGSSASDGLTRLSTLNVEGRGPAGMLARLYIDRDRDGTIDPDDTWLSEVAIAPDGSFRATITLPEQGLHHIVGVPYDPASGSQGATQGLVNALPITLDSEVGAAGIDPIAGNDIVTAGEIESTGVEIRGWGEPGARVSLVFKAGSIEDSALANLLVGADGRWSAWLPQATLQLFGNGEISVSATQTDQAGNTSVAGSGTRTFSIRTGTLNAPQGLTLDSSDDSGRFDNDHVTAQAQGLTVRGTAQPDLDVHLFLDKDGNGVMDPGEHLGSRRTGADGRFAFDVDLGEGAHLLRAFVEDSYGQTSAPSLAQLIRVDRSAAAPEQLAATQDNVFNAAEAATGGAALSGKGEAGAELELVFYVGTQAILSKTGNVPAHAERWSVALSAAEIARLGEGAIRVEIRQTDAAGNRSPWQSLDFSIDTLPVAPSAGSLALAAAYNTHPDRAWRNGGGPGALEWQEVFVDRDGQTVAQDLQLAVALGQDSRPGETLRLAWGTRSVTHTLTADDLARGYALVTVAGDLIAENRAHQEFVTVTATHYDSAGNAGETFTVLDAIDARLAGRPPSLTLDPAHYGSHELDGNVYHSRFCAQSSRDNERLLRVSGRAAPGERVILFDDADLDGRLQPGEILAEVVCDEFGNYVAQLSLDPGSYTLRVVGTALVNGLPPAPGDAHRLVIDIDPPAAPSLDQTVIGSDGRIGAPERDAGVLLSGRADPHARITLQLRNVSTGINGPLIEDIVADANGHWKATLGVVQWGAVGDGNIEILLVQTDRAGNTSLPYTEGSSLPGVVFDTFAAPPALFAIADDNRINAEEAARPVVFRGSGAPGAQVVLSYTGTGGHVGPRSVTVNAQGLWEDTLLPDQIAQLRDGVVHVELKQTDRAGNTSTSVQHTLQIDRQAQAPALSPVAEDGVINASEQALGVPLNGHAEPGAQVTVLLANGQTTLRLTTTANEHGNWTLLLTPAVLTQLGDGTVTLELRQTDPAGNLSPTAVHSLDIRATPLSERVRIDPLSGDDLLTPGEQALGVTVSGQGPAGTRLNLRFESPNGTLEGSVDIGADGRWQYVLAASDVQTTLGAGDVSLHAWAVNAQQQATALTSHEFRIERGVPSASLGRVGSDGFVNRAEAQNDLVVSGGGEAGHVVDVTLQGRSGQRITQSVRVGADRKWQLTLTPGEVAALGEGEVAVSIVQKPHTAADAPLSLETQGQFVIDTRPPAAPLASDLSRATAFNATQSDLRDGITVAEASDGVIVAIPLPADAQAGDKLVFRWGSQEIVKAITAAHLADGSARVISLDVPSGTIVAAGSGLHDLSVQFIDRAGNASAPVIIAPQTLVAAPPPPPQFDLLADDGYLNAREFESLTSGGGGLRGTAIGNGSVRLELTGSNGTTLILDRLPVTGGSWLAPLSATELHRLGEGRIEAKAIFTDNAGAASPPASSHFLVDTVAPEAPPADRLLIAAEENARGKLAGGLIRMNGAVTEAAENVSVCVALGADAQNGDTLTLHWGKQTLSVLVQQADIERGVVRFNVSSALITQEGDHDYLRVEAHLTDRAGNAGPRYHVWSGPVDAAPRSPDVAPVETDNYVNAAQAQAGWQITGNGIPGHSVIVVLEGSARDAQGTPVRWTSPALEVDADGRWTLPLGQDEARLLGNGTTRLVATQYDRSEHAGDPGGNPSAPCARQFEIDLEPPAGVLIDPVTADNRVSFSEGQSEVVLSGRGEDGARVSLVLQHAGQTLRKSATVSGGRWACVLTPEELRQLGGGNEAIGIEVVQTDPAGNASPPTTHSFFYTAEAVPAPSILAVSGIESGRDLCFNAADLAALNAANGAFTVEGQGHGLSPGYRIRLTFINADGASFTHLVDVAAGSGRWSAALSPSELAQLGQGRIQVQAVQISPQHDESVTVPFATGSVDNSFIIDTLAPSLVNASVTASGDHGNARAGDRILLTVQASEALTLVNLDPRNPPSLTLDFGAGGTRTAIYDAAASASAGADKLVFVYTVVAGDNTEEVGLVANSLALNGAALEDRAGNAAASTSLTLPPVPVLVDTQQPGTPQLLGVAESAPDTPGGGIINREEARQGIDVQVSLNACDVRGGDTLIVIWRAGGVSVTRSRVLTALEVANGQATFSLGLDDIGNVSGRAEISLQLRDASGNASPLSPAHAFDVDTLSPLPPRLDSWMADDRINKQEWDADLIAPITGQLLEAGATLTARLRQGDTFIDLAASSGANGSWTIDRNELLNALQRIGDGAFSIEVKQTDLAGNVSPTQIQQYYMDRTRPGRPALIAAPCTDDGWINLRDAGSERVELRISLADTQAVAGDRIVISGFARDHVHTLTAAEIASGLLVLRVPADVALQAPGEAPNLSVRLQARIEDQGGNVSENSNVIETRLDTIVLVPSIDVSRGAAAGITKAQSNAPVDFYGAGAEAGASIAVVLTGVLGTSLLLPSTAQADGSFKVTLSPRDMQDLGDGPVSYRVTQTDAALNTSEAASGGFQLHLSVPPPTLLLMTPDNVVGAHEANAGATTYAGLGEAGATVSLEFFVKTANGEYESNPRLSRGGVTVGANGSWSLTLSASDFAAISPSGQGNVLIRAKQTDSEGAVSGPAHQEFYIDRRPPTLHATQPLARFDGNGDGANNDGLLIAFAEPVAVLELRRLSNFVLPPGKTFGTDARIEAVDSVSINGQFYATQFRLYLDSDCNLTANDRITLRKASVVDAGGNPASQDLALLVPNRVSPGLPTPPLDIMEDNRINADEGQGVTRLYFSNTSTPDQLNAAQGGLLEIALDGQVIDRVLPKVNTLALDLTLTKAAKLPPGTSISARVRVTFLDGSSQLLTLHSTGDAASAASASNTFRFTSREVADLNNVAQISYVDSNLWGLTQPNSQLAHSSTGGASPQSTFNLTLDFPNLVHLASGKTATAQVYAYFTDINRWEQVTLVSAPGTAETAAGVSKLTYTATVQRPSSTTSDFFWESYGGITLDTAIKPVISGTDAPRIVAGYDTSIVVPNAALDGNDTLTTTLLDKNNAPIAGTGQSLSYSRSDPNKIEFTQSLSDALAAAGRKITLFVDGKAVSDPVSMGISSLFLNLTPTWENQFGNSSGWGTGFKLQAGETMTAVVRVTFKSGSGLASRDITLTATGNQVLSNYPIQFYGAFPPEIDVSKIQGIAYVPGSISHLHPQIAIHSSTITTNQLVSLPTTAWDGMDDGLKQLTAQIVTADGQLSSVYSAPKQIRLDTVVDTIESIRLQSDRNANGQLDAGDVIEIRFSEAVQFNFSALPASCGLNPVVTPIGSENGYSQLWQIRLGAGATLAPNERLTLTPGKVFDLAGNSNTVANEVAVTVPEALISAAERPQIANVSGNNVIESTSSATPVSISLAKAKAGDVVKLFIDGREIASTTVTADNQSEVSFNVAGNAWGADGERQLTSSLTRGDTTTTSFLRSVYVAADQSHWSQEAAYAGKVYWFDPDSLTAPEGSVVTQWTASAGGISVANANPAGRTVVKIDPNNGHAYLMLDAGSKFLETAVGGKYLYQAPTMARHANDATMPTAGYTDFMMFMPVVEGSQVVMRHPTFRFTANATPITYTPQNGGAPVTVAPYTQLLKSPYLQYTFQGLSSTVRSVDSPYTGSWWDTSMTNVISLGAWQMVTEAAKGYGMSFYNQMRLNQTVTLSNYIPTANNPLAAMDYLQAFAPDAEQRRFQIGGGGAGVLGDQISVSVSTNWAYQQEIGAYLAAKYQSTGAVTERHADRSKTDYDLATSNVPGAIIDQILKLNDILSDDFVVTAGADYVTTGSGNDVVTIKDLAFRLLDGGLGTDTLAFGTQYRGRSEIDFSDFISNARGLYGTAEANARVNDAGFHRLLGFEKINLVQEGGLENLRQVLTISAQDVRQLSETGVVEILLGRQDVLRTTGFASPFASEGIFHFNNAWYDHRYTYTEGANTYTLYARGGDRPPEAVGFRSIPALNQLHIAFDHALNGSVQAGDFALTSYGGPSIFAQSATSIDLRQGVALTLSGPQVAPLKLSYTGGLVDDAGRSFRHNTWILGTDGADVLDGAALSSTEKARGVSFLGGAGADQILGTSANDLIAGGLGADLLTGGCGSDTFLYRKEVPGGAAAGLGGSSGDIITDFTFTAPLETDNDRLDLSQLFEANFKATGNAKTDASNLVAGGFIELVRKTNAQTFKDDLQLWVDRDGGGAMGLLVTLADAGSNLPAQYPAVESTQQLLERLIQEGRIVVSHY